MLDGERYYAAFPDEDSEKERLSGLLKALEKLELEFRYHFPAIVNHRTCENNKTSKLQSARPGAGSCPKRHSRSQYFRIGCLMLLVPEITHQYGLWVQQIRAGRHLTRRFYPQFKRTLLSRSSRDGHRVN